MAEYTIDKIEYDGNVYKLQDNISGYIKNYTETDPVFSASAAAGIQSTDITKWNKLYNLYNVSSENSGSTYWWKLTVSQNGLYNYTNAPGSGGALGKICIPNGKSGGSTTYINFVSDTNKYNTNLTFNLPNKDGTIALWSDIPTKVSDLTNDAGYITGYTETDPVFTASAAHGISSTDITNWNGKQAALVSGTNIKTINSTSLLGSGNIAVQPTLVSGTNIKTINNNSLLGSGNISIEANYQSGTAAMLSAGTNTTNSVWTPKILHDYVQSAVGSIGYVSKTENTYTTSSSSISTIPIGISEYTSTDLLLVDINGLDLIQGTDYTVSGTNIVLATPITTSGTKVHFVDFKLVTATVSDIATLKGDAAGFGTVNATVDSGTGTPSVTVTTSGPDTAKNMSFEFHNLKGTDGTHTISYTPIVTGGAQIGTITIDNTNYPLYAPAVVWG